MGLIEKAAVSWGQPATESQKIKQMTLDTMGTIGGLQ